QGAAIRRCGARHRQGRDRGRRERPVAQPQALLPERLDEDAAGLEVRRLAVDAPAGGVSEFHGRREDDRLLTGKGTYTADWNLPGQLYGHFLRSDRAHAEIVSLKKPAGVTVFTGEDTKELKTPPPMVRYPGRGGTAIKVPRREI